MFIHPDITAAVAADRRRDLLARADACRLARASARQRRVGRSLAIAPSLARIIRRTATAAAAATPASPEPAQPPL
jgi:hypothetical protein